MFIRRLGAFVSAFHRSADILQIVMPEGAGKFPERDAVCHVSAGQKV